MRCPSCSFENPGDEERCFRCSAFLGQITGEELTPPRGKKGSSRRLWHELERRYRVFRSQRKIAEIMEPAEKYSVLLPLLLSAILPGLGQLYNRKPLKALLFFVSFLIIVGWGYSTFYNGNFPMKYTFSIFIHFMGSASYVPLIFYTWIVFDAYSDWIRTREKRSVGVAESFIVSLLITLVAVLFMVTLQFTVGTGLAMETLVQADNLRQFDLAGGDVLIIDHDYYRHHEVKVGHFTQIDNNAIIQTGREYVRGPFPSIVLGLPGETLRFTERGIYHGMTRLAALPADWQRAFREPMDFSVPKDKYYLLPAYTAPFSDHGPCLWSRERLRGKYLMIFQPLRRRRLLP
jgi:hypothetical protein